MTTRFIDPTAASKTALLTRDISGEVVMLNLLRFREFADYAAHPELAPDESLSGREAYQKYVAHTQPLLQQSGGQLLFSGEGRSYLIGPQEERWDWALLVRYKSLQDFMAFASTPAYLAGVGHRTAALADSRLLPLIASRMAA